MNKPRALQAEFGYWVKEPTIMDPARADKTIIEMAQKGYDVARIFLRSSNFGFHSPEYVKAVAHIVDIAHKHGLKAVMDCEPHSQIAGRDMGIMFPDKMAQRIVALKSRVTNGHFQARCQPPSLCCPHAPRPASVGAWLKCDGKIGKIPEFDCHVQFEQEFYGTGFAERYVEYSPSRAPVEAAHWYHFSGRLESNINGEIIMFYAFEDYSFIDLWSEACRQYYSMVVEAHKETPLDGFSWDEPGAQGNWNSYKWGRASSKAFEKMHGYKLEDKIYLLEEFDLTAEAVKVKQDYYYTMNEGLFAAQKHIVELARAKAGTDAIGGTHHTWVGEGGIGDFRAAAVDYFRLNENMDAGYTDTVWWFDGSVDYIYALGSSLGRLTPSGAHFCNNWHWKPTIAATEFAVRQMAMMRVNWFNIWYGDTGDTSLYPEHHADAICHELMPELGKCLEALIDFRPEVKIAIWHGWEGVMAVNSPVWTFGMKNFHLFGSETLTNWNIPFDFVDSRLIADGRIENGCLATKLEIYKVLIMPYAMSLPQKVWDKCKEFALAGGKVIFIGPPPVITCEGKNIVEEFAACAGIKAIDFTAFAAIVNNKCSLPINGPHRWDVNVPLDATDGKIIYNFEEEPHACAGTNDNFIYWTGLVPREELADYLTNLNLSAVKCYAGDALFREYYNATGQRKIVVIARKYRKSMNAILEVDNQQVKVSNCRLAILTQQDSNWQITHRF